MNDLGPHQNLDKSIGVVLFVSYVGSTVTKQSSEYNVQLHHRIEFHEKTQIISQPVLRIMTTDCSTSTCHSEQKRFKH